MNCKLICEFSNFWREVVNCTLIVCTVRSQQVWVIIYQYKCNFSGFVTLFKVFSLLKASDAEKCMWLWQSVEICEQRGGGKRTKCLGRKGIINRHLTYIWALDHYFGFWGRVPCAVCILTIGWGGKSCWFWKQFFECLRMCEKTSEFFAVLVAASIQIIRGRGILLRRRIGKGGGVSGVFRAGKQGLTFASRPDIDSTRQSWNCPLPETEYFIGFCLIFEDVFIDYFSWNVCNYSSRFLPFLQGTVKSN